MPEVHREPGGDIVVALESQESDLLEGLLAEYRDLLAAPDPSDPVAVRLYPRAFDDPDDERSWRSLVGGDLAAHKKTLSGLHVASTLTLDDEAVSAWLALLTDLRLAIGTRLEVDEALMAAPLDVNAPNAHAIAVLHWLGWLQELIIEAAVG